MSKFIRLLRTARLSRLAVHFIALWKVFRHPQTAPAVRWMAAAVLAYTVSPVDLIPDVMPVLGQLDDLVVIPLGVALVSRLMPRAHWEARLHEAERARPHWRRGLIAIGVLWLLVLGVLAWWVVRLVVGA
jgi:uncharacterized membrane protein YkvA (DUF1232 family)